MIFSKYEFFADGLDKKYYTVKSFSGIDFTYTHDTTSQMSEEKNSVYTVILSVLSPECIYELLNMVNAISDNGYNFTFNTTLKIVTCDNIARNQYNQCWKFNNSRITNLQFLSGTNNNISHDVVMTVSYEQLEFAIEASNNV